MRGLIVPFTWVLMGSCFSLSSSPAIAQVDTAAAEAEEGYSFSATNSSSVESNTNNEDLLSPEIMPPTTTSPVATSSVATSSATMPSVATPPTAAPPATTMTEWVEQIAQSLVSITAVQINQTEAGIEIVLRTTQGELITPTFTTVGNALIADIPNAVLSEGEVSQANPIAGIALVSVTSLPNERVRVAITGLDAPPTAQVSAETQGLVLSVALGTGEGQTGDDLQVVVTGQENNYYVPDASSATRTDTAIRDTPASIQVVPQQVIEQQQAIRLEEVLRNVSGVTFQGNEFGRTSDFAIRGFGGSFSQLPILRDGFRVYSFAQGFPELANLERVEVLKGPASILYGDIQPGGVINLVSKQPLDQPSYEVELQAGSRELIRPRFDITGPLTTDGSLLYRLNGLYQHDQSFRDYDTEHNRFFIAPTVAWQISPSTDLNVSLEYAYDQRPADRGISAFRDEVAPIPRDRVINEPDDTITNEAVSLGYNFEHRFNDRWRVRNAFRYLYNSYDFNVIALPFTLDDATGTLNRFFADQNGTESSYSAQASLEGKFNTGSIAHTLLFGVDYNQSDQTLTTIGDFTTPLPLNIFDPVYRQVPKPNSADLPLFGDQDQAFDRIGIYLQDQVDLLDNLILLAGVRYDTISRSNSNASASNPTGTETTQDDDALIPRVGIVYQPIPELSLYASYSQSFTPSSSTTVSGNSLEPERGQGYEMGVKAELLDENLFATLAFFDITKRNVAVTDPNNSLFSIASGRQRSRGIELDITGEILPGWNVIASYAYIDAEVTEDTNANLVGSQLPGIPFSSAGLWTTYEIQTGDLQGLGFGAGFNFVGERQGGLPNSFQVDSYFVPNAAIFYQHNNVRFAVNFKNLFNTDYIEAVGGSRDSGVYPGEPFTVIGSVTVGF